jgi:hypothetical protein
MLCGSQSLVKHSDGRVQIKPAPCGCWSCDTCGPKRRARVEMEIEAGCPDALLTLTLRRLPGGSPDDARKRLGLYIPALFRRVRRLTGHRFEWYVVVEKHQSGWPHVHIALRGWTYFAHSRLKALWRSVTGDSDHVHIKRIPSRQLKRYLAKYLGKDLHRFGTAKRYWRSKGYLPSDFGEPTDEEFERWSGWRYEREHPQDLIAAYQKKGWWRHDLGDGETVMTPPLWEAGAARGPPFSVVGSGAYGGVRGVAKWA